MNILIILIISIGAMLYILGLIAKQDNILKKIAKSKSAREQELLIKHL